MAESSTNAKTRVQLDLAAEEVRRMNWIMEACGLDTRKDLFNNAMTLFEWAVDEVVAGRRIASISSDDEKTFVTMPALRNAEASRAQWAPRRNAAGSR